MAGVQRTFIDGLDDASRKNPGTGPLIPKMRVEHESARTQIALVEGWSLSMGLHASAINVKP